MRKRTGDKRHLRHKKDTNSLEIWITLFDLQRQGDGSRTQIQEKEEEKEEEQKEEQERKKKNKKEVKRGKRKRPLIWFLTTLIMARLSFR